MSNVPLNAVRAFVAAGRHLSFTVAAEELSVTQGAVSQQIARLEDYLNVRLFHRRRGALALTPEGKTYLLAVAEAVERISEATDLLRPADHAEDQLSVTTLNSFAAQWLMPRLAHFQTRHPEIHLRLETSLTPLDLDQAGMDAAIRYGRGNWSGVRAEWLLDECLFPVATPDFARTLDLDAGPEVLDGVPLLYDTDGPAEWHQWMRLVGRPRGRLNLAHGFSDSLVMLRALQSVDEAVALTRARLVEAELADGRLVRLFDFSVPAPGDYYLVRRRSRPPSRALTVFRDWLIEEARAAGSVREAQAAPH